jgi:hypothetical protein
VTWVGYDEPTWIPAANSSAELKREFNQPAVSEIVSNISPSVRVEVMDETDEAKDKISSFDGPPVPPSENSESEIEEDFDNVEVEVLTTDNNQAFPEEVFGEAEEVNRYPTRARDPSGKAIRNAQASFVHSYVTILKMQQLEKVKALERDLKTTVHAYFNNVSEMTTMKKSEVFFTVPITKDKKGNWLYDGVPVSSIKVPKGVKAAVNSTYKEQWEGAMTEEYDALEEKGTWIPVYREGSDRPIGTIWVFCLKLDPSEQTLRFKARLVVAGQHRTCGIDHTQDEVFTNVLMMKSLRQLVALGLQHDDVEMEHWDIKNAFLEADMNKHITIHQPKGFYIHQGKVLKLLKALYGLPEAMRLFCDKLKARLIEMGFTPTKSDPMIYRLERNGKFILLPAYVDDIFPLYNCRKLRDEVYTDLAATFTMKNLGKLRNSLGMEFDFDFNVGVADFTMVEKKKELLDSVGFMDARPKPTPMTRQLEKPKVITVEEQRKADLVLNGIDYKSVVGSIGYMVQACCPDLAYVYSCLARFISGQTEAAAKALVHVLRYIRGTIDLSLRYHRHEGKVKSKAVFFTDASYADDFNDARSHSAMMGFTYGCLTHWKSIRQKTVSTSTYQAETVAAHLAATELVWVRFLLSELGDAEDGPTVVWQDNDAVIRNTLNPTKHEASKHINVKFHYKRELYEAGILEMLPIPTTRQLADALTKALTPEKFLTLRAGFMGHTYWPEVSGLDPPMDAIYGDVRKYPKKEVPAYWTKVLKAKPVWGFKFN